MEEDQSQWWETMGKLNRAVRIAAFELLQRGIFTPSDNHRYNWSGKSLDLRDSDREGKMACLVTEQEVVRGVLNAKDIVDHTLAFFRHIENINVALLRHSMKFIDIASKQIDEEAQRMLSDLRDVRVNPNIRTFLLFLCKGEFRSQLRYLKRVSFVIQCNGPMRMV